MCIAIYQPAGTKIPASYLKTAFKCNPDGAGFMVQKGKGTPYFEKGFFDFNDFYKRYKKFANKGYNIAIHFRVATHGKVNKDNCHPFMLSSDMNSIKVCRGFTDSAIIHNGIIFSMMTPRDAEYSDTANFAVNFLSHLKTYSNEALKNIIEQNEYTSKFVLMREGFEPLLAGNFYEDDGVYYSNFSYKYNGSFFGFKGGSYTWL